MEVHPAKRREFTDFSPNPGNWPAGCIGPGTWTPRIPAVAATGIADILARLRSRAQAVRVRCIALPPVAPSRIAALARQAGGIPDELDELLAITSGLQFGPYLLGFSGGLKVAESPPPGHSPWRLFPRRLQLGNSDGGMRCFADLGRPHLPTAPVFGLSPAPPVVVLLAPSIASFLVSVARAMPAKGDGSEWDFDPFSAIANGQLRQAGAHRSDVGVHSEGQVRRLADPVLTAYQAQLPSRTRICDLRTLEPGSCFAWADRRQVNQFHRHPGELIFGLTEVRRWWRPTAVFLGRASKLECKRWLRDFDLE